MSTDDLLRVFLNLERVTVMLDSIASNAEAARGEGSLSVADYERVQDQIRLMTAKRDELRAHLDARLLVGDVDTSPRQPGDDHEHAASCLVDETTQGLT